MNITILGAGNMGGALTKQPSLAGHFGYGAGHGTAIAPTWINR